MSNITYTSEQKDSNVGKALEYFSNIPTKSNEKNNKLYVVGHSLFMKSLWKKYNLVDDEHKKEIMKENVWDLIFDYHNNTTNITKNITFTRHAFSVANMYKERSSFKGNKPFIDQQLENDTKLSLYGILSALKISSMKKDITIQNGDTVYVSCLIRTWMTALCLYLPHLAKKNNIINNTINLTLKIANYIKEEGFTPDNTPDSPQTQLKNIKVFIEFLQKIKPSLQNCTINIKINFGDNIRNINNSINIKSISNNYKLATNINKTDEYYKKIDQIVTDKSNNIKKNSNTKVKYKEIKSLNKNKISSVKTGGGIPKPTKKQIQSFSKWEEPFSKKGSSIMSKFSFITSNKKKEYLDKLEKSKSKVNANNKITKSPNIIVEMNENNIRQEITSRPNNNLKHLSNINEQIKLYYTLNNQGKKDFYNSIPTNKVKNFYNKLKNEEKSKFNKFIKQSKKKINNNEGYTSGEYSNSENNIGNRIYERPNKDIPNQ